LDYCRAALCSPIAKHYNTAIAFTAVSLTLRDRIACATPAHPGCGCLKHVPANAISAPGCFSRARVGILGERGDSIAQCIPNEYRDTR